MDTHSPQSETRLEVYYLRGKPGAFTQLINADALPMPPRETAELREQSFGQAIGGYKLPARVLPASRWWEYYQHSAVHAACVDAKARDVVGGEFTIEGEGVGQGRLDYSGEIIERSYDALNDACRDWETTGWADLECLPTRSGGELHSLNHLDSWTVWPAKDNAAYIHMRDGKYVVYSPLGERQGPGLYQCAHFNNNHWYKNTYYGVPDIISAIIQIETAYEALQHNQDFFARKGGYRWMMLIESTTPGSEAGDPKLINSINYNYKEAGKDSNTDLLMIPLGNRKATLQRLDSDFKDMDFPALLERYRNDILMRHGVPPLRAGIVETGALGGNVGQEQIRSYVENVVKPKQRRWSAFITSILRAWVDPRIEFTFNPIEIDQVATLAQPLTTLFMADAVSRAELRDKLGLPDMDDGEPVMASMLDPGGLFGPDVPDEPQGVTK